MAEMWASEVPALLCSVWEWSDSVIRENLYRNVVQWKKNLKNKQQKNPTEFYFFLTEDVKRGLTLLPLAQKK